MRLGLSKLAVCTLTLLSACGFQHGGPLPIEVDFQSSTSLQDHASGTVMIPIVLSGPSKDPIFVDYTVGGTAVQGVDYDVVSDPMLAFAPGQTETAIQLAIHYTAAEGPDTTVQLALDNPNGARLGNMATHTMTISGVVLPRVAFENTTSAAPETMDETVNVVLDKPSPVGTTVDLTLGGTAEPGVDYTLGPNTLVFPAGQTSYPLDLGILHDNQYNSDVTIVMTLDNATKMIVGTPATHTHTINEVDSMPSVIFANAAASAKETIGTPVTVNVTLSAPSRLPVTVPFAVDAAGTTANPGDYSITTASPLTFAPGETSKPISITLVDDGIADPNKTLAIALGAPTGASLGTQKTFTLTIQDDDQTCTGTGTYQVCVQKPAATVALTGAFDTDTSNKCTNPFSGWAGGQPMSCFVVGTTITVTGTLTVTGSRPLVLVASNSITVNGTLDASSHIAGATSGPGSPFGTCAGSNGSNNSNGGGGGAGGSFMTAGGDGSDGTGGARGTAGPAVAAPTVLRAGCDGHIGGTGTGGGTSKNPGPAGNGGGVVYLVAVNSITLASGSVIDASGAGGSAPGANNSAGGSGGGSGGMIKLDAPTITATGAIVMANGGGGGTGSTSNTNGNNGNDPSTGAPTTPAAGGLASGQAGAGGDGFAGATGATAGSPTSGSNRNPGGSGGGGGGGYVESSTTLAGATVSAGSFVHP